MSDVIPGATAKSHIDQVKNSKTYEQSNFDITTWDRKFYGVEELPTDETSEAESPFTAENKKLINNKAMLGHLRFGHASLAYLKALQLKFPDNKELYYAIFDDFIVDFTCILSQRIHIHFCIHR